jgi:hypothetical protein
MKDHQPYEDLCALAATGQLTASEQVYFEDHCIQCSACRSQLQDLLSIGLHLQMDAARYTISTPMPAGSLEKFRARAIREGIPLRPAPSLLSPSCALLSAAAVFLVVVVLAFTSARRRAPETLAITTAVAPIHTPQSLPASVTTSRSTPQPAKAIQAHFARHRSVPHTDTNVHEAGLTAHQFPHVITANYSFLGSESARNLAATVYPALGRSQISYPALFPKWNGSSTSNLAFTGASNRPIDLALTGKVFDFAANIRPINFQRPIAQ